MEGIALHLDLDPAVASERLAEKLPVARERLDVALAAEVLEQTRRALDIGEEEGDGAARERLRRGYSRRLKRHILGEDRLLERSERRAGFDPELLDEHLARLPVGLERLRLAVAAVESEDLLLAQALAQGVLADKRLQLADELGVPAERELGLDPLLDRAQAQLLEAGDLALGEGLVAKSASGRPRQSASASASVAAAASDSRPRASWQSRSKRARSSSSGSTCSR
jgi:hypothetical protein